MSKHIAFLGAVAVAVMGAALPAVAADYYDGGHQPSAFHSRDDVDLDGNRAHVEHRQEPGPAYGDRRAPGPVVFDERGPDRRFDRPGYGYGEPGYRRPVAIERQPYADGSDRPVAFAPPPERFYGGEDADGFGGGYRRAPSYRAAAAAAGPGFGEGYGGPDVGCTIEQARSTTPLGWRKIVTHRTCYWR